MPVFGLRWNRGDKVGGQSDLESALSSRETLRHSVQMGRASPAPLWHEPLSNRPVSMEIPRPTSFSCIHGSDSALVPACSGHDASSASHPPSVLSRNPRYKLRSHVSETHLSAKACESSGEILPAPPVPPVPSVPTIALMASTQTITTIAPPYDHEATRPELLHKRSRLLFGRSRTSTDANPSRKSDNVSSERRPAIKKSKFPTFRSQRDPFADLQQLAGDRRDIHRRQAYASRTDLIPPSKCSESFPDSSINSTRDHSPNLDATTPDIDANRPSGQFSWLSKKQRHRKSLFPLLNQTPPQSSTALSTASASPRPSTTTRPEASNLDSPRLLGGFRPGKDATDEVTSSSITFAPHPALRRSATVSSTHSIASSPAFVYHPRPSRHRSSTLGSSSDFSEETPSTPPVAGGSARNSISTTGRSSFTNLFGLGRFRQSDAHSPRQSSSVTCGSSMPGSMSNSISLSRDTILLPDRLEGETAIQYLEGIEALVPRSQIPSLISKKTDDFAPTVMRSFMRKFAYFGDPLDMAIRKLLMEIDLPKETQQIDRVLQSFADRYHECNPGIFVSASEAYFIAFSILMLQTDAFNKNNKRKMTKHDYVKNSSIQGICDDVLRCFYDNIVYTPFIRVEDDQDTNQTGSKRPDRKTARATKAAQAAIKDVPAEHGKKYLKEPLDPYTLIFESRLDTLRFHLKDKINLEDPYTYLGTLPIFDRRVLRQSKIGIIQIESVRSRPDAFMSQSGIANPDEARVGLVDLPIDKVGVLWRKDLKKKTARSPWQEWGVILTGAGLYFFKNAGWIKNYLHQYETHLKHGGAGSLCSFKPPLSQFKPDYLLPTDHGVALQDSTYKRHKNAFEFFSHNGSEVFLADTDSELNDWLARLNHQAACKTAGIGPRGPAGDQNTGQKHWAMRKPNPSQTLLQTNTGHVDHTLAQQISTVRKAAIVDQIKQLDTKLHVTCKQLEDKLRDARHLLIQAPVQSKTRELLRQAAIRVQARIDALRVDKWRFQCHQDILNLDLEEEQPDAERWQARTEKLSAESSSSLEFGSSPTSNGSDSNWAATSGGLDDLISQDMPPPPRNSYTPQNSSSSIKEDFYTPPEFDPLGKPPSPCTPRSIPISPSKLHESFNRTSSSSSSSIHRQSLTLKFDFGYTSPQQPRAPRSSFDASVDNTLVLDCAVKADKDLATVQSDLDDLKQGDLSLPSRPKTPTTPEFGKSLSNVKYSPSANCADRGRSRTVSSSRRKDAQPKHRVPHLDRRSTSDMKEAKDKIKDGTLLGKTSLTPLPTLAMKSDKQKDKEFTSLVRDTPMFTVHGKKASIVTLGLDWAGTSPKETLLRMKEAAATNSNGPTGKELQSLYPNPNHVSPLRRITNADDDTNERREIDGDETPTPGSPTLVFNKFVFKPTTPDTVVNSQSYRTSSTTKNNSITSRTDSSDVLMDDKTRHQLSIPASAS